MFETKVEKALDEVRRLREVAPKLRQREREARASAVQIRATLGEVELAAILDGTDGPAASVSLLELESKAAAASAALRVLTIRLEEAGRDLNRARAEEIRKQARSLEKELEEHNRQREKALRVIEELEGVPFGPIAGLGGETGTVGGRTLILGPMPVIREPKSQLLAARIRNIYTEASAIEKRVPRLDGEISAESFDDLLTKLGKVELMAPAEEEVRAWLSTAESADELRWVSMLNEQRLPQAPRRGKSYLVAWDREGLIDEKRSRVESFPVFGAPPREAA